MFTAAVVLRDLPNQLGLTLDASGVSVVVQAVLVRLSESRTKLISRETFRFEGLFGKVLAFVACTWRHICQN
jgi:hypothetical protein